MPDRGPFKTPALWADVRDGSLTEVSWNGDDLGCPRCGAESGAQCNFQDARGDGIEVGGWVHVDRVDLSEEDDHE